MLTKTGCCFFGLLFLASIASVQSLDCLDASNTPVAWWAELKLPQSLKIPAHLYYDATDDATHQTSFRLQNKDVDGNGTALCNTLDQLNKIPRSDVRLMAFNDQYPDGTTRSDRAHAKGVVAYDTLSMTGFYIMHSTPRFPAINDTTVDLKLPKTGVIYAQHFICIGIDHEGFHSIIDSLAVSRPNVYYDNTNLKPANSLDHVHSETIRIRLNRQEIILLSKSPNHLQYFYSTVVSPFFNVNLAVESWSHPVEPPQCSESYNSLNIHQLQFDNKIRWTVYQDHSKWAISYEGNRNIACFSDINRAKSQNKRGGGALCFNGNSHIYYALKNLVTGYDSCNPSFLPFFE